MSEAKAKPEIPSRFHNVVSIGGQPWRAPQPVPDESKLIRKLNDAREFANLFAKRGEAHSHRHGHAPPEIYAEKVYNLIDSALAMVRKLEKKLKKAKQG
jgi:hypothetical protein